MSSIFGGLEVAKTGLYISQQAMNVTANNISNANTRGYTRQRINTEALYPSINTRFHDGVAVGSGVRIEDVDQIRSEYVDRQLRNGYSAQGYSNTRAQEMESICLIVNETSDNSSISLALSDFYGSLNYLTTSPDNAEIRTNVQQNGLKLCDALNYYYNQLVDQQNLYNDSMKATVDSINGDLSSIADYNRQIAAYELGGQSANELRDKRALALDDLSKLININYSEDETGQITIMSGGTTLVDKNNAFLLDARPELTGVVSGESGYYQIYVTGQTSPLDYSDGQLKAYKDLRDGDSVDNLGVPYLLDNLNTLARSIASALNTVHETGYTIPIGSGSSLTGIDFFKVPIGGYNSITAGNITLSDEVLANVNNIAASSNFIDLTAANTEEGNNEKALEMYALFSSDDIAGIGSFSNFLKSFIVRVGISSASAKDMNESQDTIVGNLENRRETISGVSIDEEMVNLMASQHAFSAAARMLTAIDEALDTLINRTGIVGS